MNTANAVLAFLYVCIWSADGFNFGRLARRYYREEKLRWPNGKFTYTIDWILSMGWFIGSAFILGELDHLGDFNEVESLGPLALIVAAAASLYHYRSR